MPERAVLYVRVSSLSQSEDGSSLETQEARCRAYCEERGYAVVAVCRDVATGSEWRERKGLSAARQHIRDGTASVLVSYAIDRLSRHQTHLALVAEEVEDHGARLEFVTESFEDSAVGRFIRSAKGFAAEVEREKLIERTGRGLRARVTSGKPLAGHKPPYGYRWRDAEKSGLDVEEDEAAIVRRVYGALASGESAASLARALTKEGTPSPTGLNRWAPAVLCVLVRHPIYKGEAVSYRWRMLKKRPGKRRALRQERPSDEWSVLPEGTAPAIVPGPLWARAIASLEGTAVPRSRPGTKSEAYLLAGGYVTCGSCGGALTGSVGPKNWRNYRCSANRRITSEGCTSTVTVSQAALDAAVWDYVWRLYGDPRAFRRLWEQERARRTKRQATPDTRLLDTQRTALERKLARLTRELANADDDDAETWREQRRRALAELRRIDAAREEVTQDGLPQAESLAQLDALRDAPTLLAALDEENYAEKREALALFGVRVVVNRGDLRTGERWRITSLLDG